MKACVDIGGTKIAVSLNSGAGLELVGKRSEPTAKTGSNDAVAQQVIRLVEEACREIGVDPSVVQRVGVSSAGPFVLNAGLVELASPNICGGIAGPARGLPNTWMTEALVAGNAVARRFGADAATLMQRARSGDAEAIARVEELCRIMGRALYNIT